MKIAFAKLDYLKILGRLSGGNRSVAVWVCGEEGVGSSFQVVVATGKRRDQIFIPSSAFGDGSEGVALVIEGFGVIDEKVLRPGGFKNILHKPVSATLTNHRDADMVVCTRVEVDWFRLLDRSLVGMVEGRGGKGLSFAAISEWVGRWWRQLGMVKVQPLGVNAFLFVFKTRSEAETMLRQRWTVGGLDLLLEWWSPLTLCTSGKMSLPEKSVWIRVVGLPTHLRGEEVYRVLGDQCGGFVEANKSSVDLGCIRLRMRCSEHTLS
ncbi:hypothetical protein LOK49_LG02G01561 [Camellia lanceoleosa]|uniref:Uncharacterized protein n=1 Tax=Camellia lanceoleosa TaxID=1840588 RepID=A0ACC0II82_9ERIC|nr:hypothetical protein LOK49_LG02G01561 [Camellia lanceoleosa]